MPGGIFLLDPAGELTEMAETAVAAEIDLQQLLARHPDLLAGDQIDPGTPRRNSVLYWTPDVLQSWLAKHAARR